EVTEATGDPKAVQSVRRRPATSSVRGEVAAVRGVPTIAAAPIGRSTMSEPTTNALPIVLIHGLWMTARSWDRWVEYYRAKGHEVIVPTYPGFEIEVEALREKPEVIAEASVPETLDHLTEVVESLDRPPIIMGHSFGG